MQLEFSLPEAASRLNLSEAHVIRLAADGNLPVCFRHHGRIGLFRTMMDGEAMLPLPSQVMLTPGVYRSLQAPLILQEAPMLAKLFPTAVEPIRTSGDPLPALPEGYTLGRVAEISRDLDSSLISPEHWIFMGADLVLYATKNNLQAEMGHRKLHIGNDFDSNNQHLTDAPLQELAFQQSSGAKPECHRTPATAADLAGAFHLLGFTPTENLKWWKSRTGNATNGKRFKWLGDCCMSRGRRGTESSTWNPAAIAVALVGKKLIIYPAASHALKNNFPDWAEDFEQYGGKG